jgi:hypothetical protein
LRLGEGDLGERDRVIERDLVGEPEFAERRGEPDCADRGRLGDLVCDRSRVGLRVRERAGEGEGKGMSRFSRNWVRSEGLTRAFQYVFWCLDLVLPRQGCRTRRNFWVVARSFKLVLALARDWQTVPVSQGCKRRPTTQKGPPQMMGSGL